MPPRRSTVMRPFAERTVVSGLRYRNLDPAFPFVAVKTTARVNGAEAEFLTEAIPDYGRLLSLVFLKGYQWPFDIRKAFEPIVVMTSQPYILVVNPSSPAKSTKVS